MKLKVASVIFVSLLSVAPGPAHACRADAEVENFWVEKDGWKQKASIGIEVEEKDIGLVKVYVDARFHYEREDGWTNTLTTKESVSIDTDETSSETMVMDAIAVNCGDGKECEIHDVEIFGVKCFD